MLPREADGTLSPYAWPGGYDIVYLDKDCEPLCAACAQKEVENLSGFYVTCDSDSCDRCCECNAQLGAYCHGDDHSEHCCYHAKQED